MGNKSGESVVLERLNVFLGAFVVILRGVRWRI